MTVRIEVCTDIAIAPDALWAVLEPVEAHVDWMADAETIRFTSDRTRGVGTEFACVTRVGPVRLTDHMRVTEWEPGRTMGIEHRGIVRGSGRFSLDARGGGTRFCWTEQLTFPWWMVGALGERAARPVLRRIWRANLARLAHQVESGRGADPGAR